MRTVSFNVATAVIVYLLHGSATEQMTAPMGRMNMAVVGFQFKITEVMIQKEYSRTEIGCTHCTDR